MMRAHSADASINDMTYNPPPLPDYLSKTHNLTAIVGVPTDEEVKLIHDTIRTVNSVSNVPALYDHNLSTKLAQYLFTVQMAVYRNEYPSSISSVDHTYQDTYTPPAVPSHMSISLKPVVGAPSDNELESAHGAVLAMENLVNTPFFDPALSVKLSQHLFNVQFARYIQDSNQGHFTRRPTNPSPQINQNEPLATRPNPPPEVVGQPEPQYIDRIEPELTTPILSQQSRTGQDTSSPGATSVLRLIEDKMDKLATSQQSEETNQLLKIISRALVSTFSVAHRASGVNYNGYRTMNDKGELPWMHHLPDVYSSSIGGLSLRHLIGYLRFYDIGAELIQEGTGNIQPEREADARDLLKRYLFHGGPAAPQTYT